MPWNRPIELLENTDVAALARFSCSPHWILFAMAKLAVLIGHLCFWLGRSNPSVCGSKPDEVSGCQMKDMGSCGNACCVVEVGLKTTPEQTYELTKKTLQDLSEDGFTYVTGGEPNPGDDLRPYNISSPEMFKFILQGRHDAPKYYGTNGDILNFAIYQSGASSSVLRMFSLSRIHGALGDNGQNYKSLSFLAEKMQIQSQLAVKHGCGAPLSSLPRELNEDSSASFPSYCGGDASKDPDCARKDFGSCGNACCLVELQLNQSPEKVHQALIDGLTPSKGFSYVTGGQPDPADDLRPYNITSPEKFQFIAQGRHDAPKYYGTNGDILNFAIYQTSASSSVLRMFSLSRIHGALGDNGQNYKSLSLLAKTFKADMNVKYGCGLKSEVNLV